MLKLNKHDHALDILRIFACFLVIVNHTNSDIFLMGFPSASGKASLLYFLICKMGVPIFFMISGCLLLKKEESYLHWFKKRVLRILVVLLAASLLVDIATYGSSFFSEFNIFEYLAKVIEEPRIIPFWYLYTYFAILLVLPFLRKMVKNFEQKDYLMFFAIGISITILYPFLCIMFALPMYNYNFIITIFYAPILYFALGHYLINVYMKQKEFQRKRENIIGSIIFVLIIGLAYLITANEFYAEGSFVLKLDDIKSLTIFVSSVVCFYLGYRNLQTINLPKRLENILASISETTFGIYIIHATFLSYTWHVYLSLSNYMNVFIACIFYQIFVFICCFAIIKVMKKIPVIKNYI